MDLYIPRPSMYVTHILCCVSIWINKLVVVLELVSWLFKGLLLRHVPHNIKFLLDSLPLTSKKASDPPLPYNRVCASRQEFVFDKSKCFVYRWYTSVWSPSNTQTDAAFSIEISCTRKVLKMFKNDRIIVKTRLVWCPKPNPHGSAASYAINRHEQGLIRG